jgi:hypothetical protein
MWNVQKLWGTKSFGSVRIKTLKLYLKLREVKQ